MNTISINNNQSIPASDMHTHTGFSDDCEFSVEEMISGAVASGIKILAVTDHYDPGYPDPEFPFTIDFNKYQETLASYKEKYHHKMDILTGLEVGIMEGQFEAANAVINAYDYDFIIGSFHCYREYDLYTMDYSRYNGPELVEDFYSHMYYCLKAFNNFDVMGHLSILDRYIGKLYDYGPVEDIIDEILKLLIHEGKGIEINTSSFKYGMGTWLPRESIIKRYKELGGEILTFGSDAHDPKYYRSHFQDAVALAKQLGFKYHCVFINRKPEFLLL